MEKREYEPLEMEIIEFDVEDVITTSVDTIEGEFPSPTPEPTSTP